MCKHNTDMEKDSNGQSIYTAKSRLHVEMEYQTYFTELSSILIEWHKAKPENEQLNKAAKALAKIGIIVAGYQMELQGVERMVSQYRADRLKYQKEAYDAEERLAKYEQKYFDDEQ